MSLDTAKATAQLTSITAKFDTGMLAATPFYPEVCTIFPSKVKTEDYAWLGNMPGVREWIGERQFQELRAARYLLANKLWETSVAIDREDIEDDRVGLYGPILEGVGREAAQHPDELFFNALVNGGANVCYDGQYFFDTDHAWGDSGTQSNDISSSASTPAAPTATEWKTAFTKALTSMAAFKNDQGKLLNRPTFGTESGLLAVIPMNMWQAAVDATQSTMISNSSNLLVSPVRIVASPYLTTTTKFYLFKTDGVLKPMVFQARRPVQRAMKGLDDREFRAVKFMADARYNVGYLAWWAAMRITLS